MGKIGRNSRIVTIFTFGGLIVAAWLFDLATYFAGFSCNPENDAIGVPCIVPNLFAFFAWGMLVTCICVGVMYALITTDSW